jgi:hypothetical protein
MVTDGDLVVIKVCICADFGVCALLARLLLRSMHKLSCRHLHIMFLVCKRRLIPLPQIAQGRPACIPSESGVPVPIGEEIKQCKVSRLNQARSSRSNSWDPERLRYSEKMLMPYYHIIPKIKSNGFPKIIYQRLLQSIPNTVHKRNLNVFTVFIDNLVYVSL